MSTIPALLVSALAGRYRLLEEVGHGGMAVVYLAEDLRHHRRVAIKVLRQELAAALGPERFLREIETTASLRHPHILPLFDSGAAGHQGGDGSAFLYYVMPYVEGESLRDRLNREKQLPIETALKIAGEVADALDYADSRRTVHRDIKPENILLERGHAVVADFGIARAVTAAGRETLTQTGMVIGTPHYMSPEQAMGEKDLDGRSDQYALACVLYEMLAGHPPYTGPTVQAIVARQLTDPVPSLRTVRTAIPIDVEHAINRALSKVPADRFETTGKFAAALAAGEQAGVGVETTTRARSPDPATRQSGQRFVSRRGWVVVPIVAMLVVAVIASWRLLRPGSASQLDPDLVAITPFNVLGAELQSWHEGLVDVLSRSLDGAGALRTVSPSVSLRQWSGRADAAAAEALGRRTGAGLVVFGDLVAEGKDSVRLRAAWLNLVRSGPPLEVEVRGMSARVPELIDQLTRELLRTLGGTRPVGAVRQMSFGSTPVLALKSFLRGEQFYRRAQWDSALAQYHQAIEVDSNFALAYRRMGLVLGWNSEASTAFEPMNYALRAAALNHGLAPRDSLLILADSLFDALSPDQRRNPFADRRRLFAILDEATRRYPGDPEVWYALGEARTHAGNSPEVATPEETLEAFDHALALDSSFAPAYEHLTGLAMQVGDASRARQYLGTYFQLNPHDDYTAGLRLAARMLDPAMAGSAETAAIIDTIHGLVLYNVGVEYLDRWPDSAETSIRLIRALSSGRRSFRGAPWWVSTPEARRRSLAVMLSWRGHLSEAYALYPEFAVNPPGTYRNPYVTMALLGAVPPEKAVPTLRSALDSLSPATLRFVYRVVPWWFAQRDTASLLAVIRKTDSLALRATDPGLAAVAPFSAAQARAYLTLLRRDSTAALAAFAALPDSVCILADCEYSKLTQARLLAAFGQDHEAGAVLDRWQGQNPLSHLEAARIAERLGDRDRAIRSYQYVIDFWRHADPELQGYVAEAKKGLERLVGEQ